MAPFCQEVPCMDQHISKWDTQSAVVQVGIWPWRQQKKILWFGKGMKDADLNWMILIIECIHSVVPKWTPNNAYRLISSVNSEILFGFCRAINSHKWQNDLQKTRRGFQMTCVYLKVQTGKKGKQTLIQLKRKTSLPWHSRLSCQFDQAAEVPFERFQVLALAASILWWK